MNQISDMDWKLIENNYHNVATHHDNDANIIHLRNILTNMGCTIETCIACGVMDHLHQFSECVCFQCIEKKTCYLCSTCDVLFLHKTGDWVNEEEEETRFFCNQCVQENADTYTIPCPSQKNILENVPKK